MKSALHQLAFTVDPCGSFFTVAADAKFQGIEMLYEKISYSLLSGEFGNIKVIRDTLESCQLKLVTLQPSGGFNLATDHDFRKYVLPTVDAICEMAYKLECEVICVAPSLISEEMDQDSVRGEKVVARTQKLLGEILRRAKLQDIKVAFEHFGFERSLVRGIEVARRIVEPMMPKWENLGFLIDSFHLALAKTPWDALGALENLWGVRISDIEFQPEDDLSKKTDADRVLPGTGNIDLSQFFHALKELRFKRYVGVKWTDAPNPSRSSASLAQLARDSIRPFVS